MKEGFRACGNKGFHIKFKNGWVVSVQFGGGNYCNNYENPIETYTVGQSCENAEVWCMHENGNYPEEPLSHQSPEDVLKLLNEISKRECAEK